MLLFRVTDGLAWAKHARTTAVYFCLYDDVSS